MKQSGRNFTTGDGQEIDIDVSDWPHGKVLIRVTRSDKGLGDVMLITEREAQELRDALNEWAAE